MRPFIQSAHSAREGETPLPPHPPLAKGGMGGGGGATRAPVNCLIITFQECQFYYETVNKLRSSDFFCYPESGYRS